MMFLLRHLSVRTLFNLKTMKRVNYGENGCYYNRQLFGHRMFSTTDNDSATKSTFKNTTTTPSSHGDHLLQWLQKEGCLDLKHERPLKIIAEPWNPRNTRHQGNDNAIITKIIHFQRHGQGYHNFIYTLLDEQANAPSNVYDTNPHVNPFVREELIDAPLTHHGRHQCQEQHDCHFGGLENAPTIMNPELIVVSPLTRCLETSLLTFQHLRPRHNLNSTNFKQQQQQQQHPNNSTLPQQSQAVPFIAHEDLREEMGLLLCNKRRPISELARNFPDVDFSLYHHRTNSDDNNNSHHNQWHDQDTLFCPTTRESALHQSERIYRFLVDFLALRSESEIAVVGHSAWLFHMCHGVMECRTNTDDDDDRNPQDCHQSHTIENNDNVKNNKLLAWFGQADLRSMKVTFIPQES